MGSAIRNISTASVSTVEQAIPNIAFNGTTVIATAQQQEGYVLSGTKSSIAYIPSEYIIPSGVSEITQNGTYDIKQYSAASINVPTFPEPSGAFNITENGSYDIKSYANANVYISNNQTFNNTQA